MIPIHLPQTGIVDGADATPWHACRFMSCSVLPVRVACNLRCPFCFSKSSLSALRHERTDWRRVDVDGYYRFAQENGATRLVITGGGEPLLRPEDVVYLVQAGPASSMRSRSSPTAHSSRASCRGGCWTRGCPTSATRGITTMTRRISG